MDINKLASITQLRSEQQKEIAEIIGIEAYKRLVEYFGGCHLNIEFICGIVDLKNQLYHFLCR